MYKCAKTNFKNNLYINVKYVLNNLINYINKFLKVLNLSRTLDVRSIFLQI